MYSSKYLKKYNKLFSLHSSRFLSTKSSPRKAKTTKVESESPESYKMKIKNFFESNEDLTNIKHIIPAKYRVVKRSTLVSNLYLVDKKIAKQAARYILEDIKNSKEQIICESNAGLGLITSELLNNNLRHVRLYESCSDFRDYLKTKFTSNNGHVEIFDRDIFLIHRYDYMDRQDGGNRVQQLLEGVQKKCWNDDPIMTIIGPLPNMLFIKTLIRSLFLQTYITSLGRIQLYVFMRPRDYITLTAGPHLNLHTYQRVSIFFNLFFDCELIEKFSRDVFLPWQLTKYSQLSRYPAKIDSDLMYLVKINFKKQLPIATDDLLPFFTFIQQFYGTGTKRIIPALERWVPGCGKNLILPEQNHKNFYNIDIFTKFGELTPEQILSVFKEITTLPTYEKNHFLNLIESHLMKTETIETSLNDHLEKNVDDTDKV